MTFINLFKKKKRKKIIYELEKIKLSNLVQYFILFNIFDIYFFFYSFIFLLRDSIFKN